MLLDSRAANRWSLPHLIQSQAVFLGHVVRSCAGEHGRKKSRKFS
jgi:hypothetical protein